MERLVANYASSDEEEEEEKGSRRTSSLLSSLPKPKSEPICSPSLYASLRNPKSEDADQPLSNTSFSQPNPKKVVLLKPRIATSFSKETINFDDDDEEDASQHKPRKESPQISSVSSFLSSIPAPRNTSTLGVLPSASGSSRRSIMETDAVNFTSPDSCVIKKENTENCTTQETHDYGNYAAYEGSYVESSDQFLGSGGGDGCNYFTDAHYADYEQPAPNHEEGSKRGLYDLEASMFGKRRKKDLPIQLVEVKQDELMKNRPREDQAKSTGIAFGPSYQPPPSAKAKPSKLHKRKHQIGSLYFDMKQKETELSERRSKGFLTKAETQAKYGW